MDIFSKLESALGRQITSDQETQVRIRTGVIGGGLLLFLLVGAGHFGSAIASAILASAMAWELGRIFIQSVDKKEKLNALVGLAWLVIFINLLLPKSLFEGLIFSTIGLFAYYLAIADRHVKNLRTHLNELVYSVFVLVYAVCFIGFLPLIRMGSDGLYWLILFLLIVWSNDTGAYFAGKKWGKKKLYPLISPNKTVEGALGGLATGFVVSLLFKVILFKGVSVVGVFFTSLAVGGISQVGDFCESFLKRACQVKDTSQILPGHGGILDRFDGVLFSAPVMYLCSRFFGA